MNGKLKIFQQTDDRGDLVGYAVVDPSDNDRVLAAFDAQADGSLQLSFLDGAKDPNLWENEYFTQSKNFVEFNQLEDRLILLSGDIFETTLGHLSFNYFLTELDGGEFELPAGLSPEKYSVAGKISFFEEKKPRVDMLLIQETANGKSYLAKDNGLQVETIVIAKFKKAFSLELPLMAPPELH